MPTEEWPEVPPTEINLDDLVIAIQSTRLMLYEMQGHPMGRSYAGFQAWAAVKGQQFVDFCGGEMEEEQEESLDQQVEDTQLFTTAIGYQLYKLLGCPQGNSITGFEKWSELIQNELLDALEEHDRQQP